MKKMLAVLLVLSISSLSSAAVVGLVEPSAPVDPGTEVIIKVVTDTKLLSLGALVTVEGPGEIIAGTSAADGAAKFGWDAALSMDTAVDGASAAFTASNFNGMPADVAPGLGIVGELTFVAGEADAILTIANDPTFGGSFTLAGATPEYGAPITVSVIPEPMTLSLLGLGGLALIRRRR